MANTVDHQYSPTCENLSERETVRDSNLETVFDRYTIERTTYPWNQQNNGVSISTR